MLESEVLCVVVLYCRNHGLNKLQKHHQISTGQSRRNNTMKSLVSPGLKHRSICISSPPLPTKQQPQNSGGSIARFMS